MKSTHVQEFKRYGAIRDRDALFDTHTYNPRTFPGTPFDYLHLVKERQFPELKPNKYGSEVAIIGGGCAGLCAAYELMQMGLRPVIYEASERLGGRTYTHRFARDPKAYAEIGAMRLPKGHHPLVHHYINKFGLKLAPFPSPLKVPTTIYFNRKRYDVEAGASLPPEIQPVADRWDALMNKFIEPLAEVKDDPVEFSRRWAAIVDEYQHKSIFQVLHDHGWPKEIIDEFGSIGAGGAPFGPFYHQVSFVEPLRVVSLGWWGEVEQVVGGIDQIPLRFWDTEADCTYWGRTSVKELNYGAPRAGVKSIETTAEGIYITDQDNKLDKYDAVIVTCTPRNLEMSIEVNRETFSENVWNAIRNMYLIPGGRISLRTKTAFWKKNPELLRTTVTDEPLTHLFCFDFEDTPSGVVCLSYTLGITAIKFDAFDDQGKVENCMRGLEKIYGPETVKVLREQMVEDPLCFSWEEAPGYNGSFKMPVPGFSTDELVLFSQGKFHPEQRSKLDPHPDNGVYLAGDTISWASGWIEGALHTAINSSISVVQRYNNL